MIDVDDVSFTYGRGTEPVLKHLGFSVSRGEIFGFLGPSGAGKSTTQKILIGLLKGYRGRIHLLGRDLEAWGADLYERIGISFEQPNHYLKLTALENLAYFRSLYAGPAEEPQAVLERVGLGEDGHKRVSEFSKGMRNRLNVARALLHRPELLFLDEPTSGLDPVNARRIKDLIRQQQAAGTTVFMTTHNMTVADELCDRVAFIVDGAIQLIDAPEALKLHYGQRVVRVAFGTPGRLQEREYPLEGLWKNADFLDVLRTEQVQTIHTQETTLENIFIHVTGRALV